MKGKAIPVGFHTLTPYLCVRGAAEAIDFYKRAFGAQAIHISHWPGTEKVMNAQLRIGDSMLMLNDEFPPNAQSPEFYGGSPASVHMYVEEVDKVYNHAVAAGAMPEMPPADMFWGDRYARVKDPFGHTWSLATHLRDMTGEEMQQAANEFFARMRPQP
jgi:PhnB protein